MDNHYCCICIPSLALYKFAWRIDKVKVCTIIILKPPKNFLILFLLTKYCWGEAGNGCDTQIWEDKILNWTARANLESNVVDSNKYLASSCKYFTFPRYLIVSVVSVSIVSFKRALKFFQKKNVVRFRNIFQKNIAEQSY